MPGDDDMTVTTTNNKVNHLGNGVQLVFSYNYLVLDQSHMQVYVDDVYLLSGYTVDGIGDPNGGNVTFDTAPADGSTVTLLRFVPEEQQIDYRPYDPFPAETMENGLDLLTMMIQQLQENAGRAISLTVSDDGTTSVVMPAYSSGDIIGWSETTKELENLPYPEPEDPEPISERVIYGRIDGATGTAVVSSNGFTSARTSEGLYYITLTPAITEPYVALANASEDNTRAVRTYNPTSAGFNIASDDLGGSKQDTDTSFVVHYYAAQARSIPVTNFGFETGDLTAWNIIAGNPIADTESGGGAVLPYAGSYMLAGDAGDTPYEVESDLISLIDAGMSATAIDDGKAYLTVSCYQRRFGPDNDKGKYGISYYDVSQVFMSTIWSSENDPAVWTFRDIRNLAPAGTRYVTLRAYSNSDEGTFASAYFDNFGLAYDERV